MGTGLRPKIPRGTWLLPPKAAVLGYVKYCGTPRRGTPSPPTKHPAKVPLAQNNQKGKKDCE